MNQHGDDDGAGKGRHTLVQKKHNMKSSNDMNSTQTITITYSVTAT